MDVRWQTEPLPEPPSWLIEYDFENVVFLAVARVDGGYFVRSDKIADFLVPGGGEPAIGVLWPGVSEAEGLVAFRQQVRPTMYQLAGACALHASAVTTPLGTLAFVGPSGAGKSTLAALLARGDWRLLSDDYVPLEREGPLVFAHPTSSRVRLRPATAEQLDEPGSWHWGKWAVDRPSQSDPSRLIGVYDIGEPGDVVTIQKLRGHDAVGCLAKNLHRMDPHDQELLRAELDHVLAVSQRVPVRRLVYPRRFDIGDELQAALRADLELTRG